MQSFKHILWLFSVNGTICILSSLGTYVQKLSRKSGFQLRIPKPKNMLIVLFAHKMANRGNERIVRGMLSWYGHRSAKQ